MTSSSSILAIFSSRTHVLWVQLEMAGSRLALYYPVITPCNAKLPSLVPGGHLTWARIQSIFFKLRCCTAQNHLIFLPRTTKLYLSCFGIFHVSVLYYLPVLTIWRSLPHVFIDIPSTTNSVCSFSILFVEILVFLLFCIPVTPSAMHFVVLHKLFVPEQISSVTLNWSIHSTVYNIDQHL